MRNSWLPRHGQRVLIAPGFQAISAHDAIEKHPFVGVEIAKPQDFKRFNVRWPCHQDAVAERVNGSCGSGA